LTTTAVESAPVAGIPIVSTIAGIGPPDVGDGRAAVDANLQSPFGLLAASDGSIYIADSFNDRVRRVTTDGIIHTIAGTGTAETQMLGDGLLATQAQLRFPRAMDFGPDGSLYIADSNHYVIRRIAPNGIISTVAGNRNPIYSGDGGVATQASFSFPIAVSADVAGNLYVADEFANRIRRVGTDGNIQTIAGTGTSGSTGDNGQATQAQIRDPRFVTVDKANSLLFFVESATTQGLYVIRQVNLASGIITTVGNSASDAQTTALDNAGNLILVKDAQIWQLNPSTASKTAIASIPAQTFVSALCVDQSGVVYFTDPNQRLVFKVSPNGQPQTFAGGGTIPGDGLPATSTVIYDSQGFAIDTKENLFFSDFDHNRIRKIDGTGKVTTVAGTGSGNSAGDGGHPLQASFSQPLALIFDPKGNLLFLDLTRGTGTVRLISPGGDGTIDGSSDERIISIAGKPSPRTDADHGAADGGRATNAVFNAARGLCVDSHSNIFISDIFDNRIRKVVAGADGALNGGADEIISRIAGNGNATSTGNGGPASQASVDQPLWIACDRNDNVYLHEASNIVRRITAANGIIDLFISTADVGKPWSFVFDSSSNLYLATGTQVFSIDAVTKSRTLVAGTGQAGFSGDGGDARLATFQGYQFIAIDSTGNLYGVDNGNFRIRKITGAAPTSSPILITETNSTRAIALDSVSMLRDPFSLSITYNFSSDQRTRLMLFAMNVSLMPGDNSSVVTCQAEDSQHHIFAVPVEYVGDVPNLNSITQVNIRLPDGLTGDMLFSITVRGIASNQVLVTIR
jgi:sugar lactone lactonase YvrE